jgi:hypothetical protein
MKHNHAFWNELESNSVLYKEEVSNWISETKPIAQQFIPQGSTFYGRNIEIDFEFIEPKSSSLGRWMGCIPQLKDNKGHITIIPDWSFFLYVLYLSFSDIGINKRLLEDTLLDRSRLRIGITNDVFQPYAPLPDNYSMLRHHSLMLYLAIEWLPENKRNNWKTICHIAGVHVAQRLSTLEDPLQDLKELENSAQQIMQKTASASCSRSGAIEILNDALVMKTISRYFVTTYFGIDVLNYSRSKSKSRDWIRTEIESKLNDPEYMNHEINLYIRHHAVADV